MNTRILATILTLVSLAAAQNNATAPRTIRFSAQVAAGQPDQTAPIAFTIYSQPENGTAVWSETQTVTIKDSKFSVLLGSTQPDGIPVSIFASADARWLQWQIAGQDSAPRVQLVSVPYALSAVNAETFAGHSLSDFVLAAPASSNSPDSPRSPRNSRSSSTGSTGTGIQNMVAKFNTASTTTVSQLYDDGIAVGIGTVAPSAKLDVAGDLKISGADSAVIFPDGTRFTSSPATGISSKNIEQVRFADQFASGSQTGGIAEAYADCPATGCKVQLGTDVNIATPQVITVRVSKPLFLDLAGRVIKVSNAAGVGLTFTSENINTRTPMTIQNGTLSCSWTQPNVVGFEWASSVNVTIEKLDVRNCNTPGSTAIVWDFVEDAHMNGVGFRNNANALRVQNASNQVSFRNVWFDSNVNPMIIQDDTGVTLEDCLVQSNVGARAVQVLTSAGNNATTLRIHKCHFENNGDSTANSRNIYIAPAASQYILGVSIEDNVFTSGAYGASGTSVEVAGSHNVMPVEFQNNQYNGYAVGKIIVGAGNDSRLTSIGENLAAGSYGYDVGINTQNLTGLSFAPTGSQRAFQLFAGSPGNYDGFLQFWDVTGDTSILNYSAGAHSWTFPTTAVFDAPVVLNDSQSIFGYSDHQQTQTWGVNGATGAARFDGGVAIGANGLSINNGAPLTSTVQTGTGAIVMSHHASLVAPDLGDARATSLTLSGETISASPRMIYSAAIVNPSVAALQSRWTLDKAIVVTRFQFVINNGGNSGCGSSASLQLTDGATTVTLPISNGQVIFDSGSIALTFSAGATLDIAVANSSTGCSTVASSGNATVQYRMQ